jgi:putative membrane protein
MNYKVILSLILAGFCVVFIIQNVAIVEIRFLFWKIEMSRALLIFIVLAIGIIVGWLIKGHFRVKEDELIT